MPRPKKRKGSSARAKLDLSQETDESQPAKRPTRAVGIKSKLKKRVECSVILQRENTSEAASASIESNNPAGHKKAAQPVTIHSLPEELLIELFEYLGHGDRLSARCACKNWCNVMSNWTGFNNNVVYLVKAGTESRSILRDTQVPWKRIRIEKIRLDDKEKGYCMSFNIPPSLADIVTSVEFSKSIVSWDGLQHLLVEFQALEEISIIQCKRRRKEALSPIVPLRMTRANQQFQQTLLDALKKVTSVTLELRRISDMLFYLTQLNKNEVSGLVHLSLKDVYDGIETVNHPGTASDLLSALLTLIQRSATTLKTLRVNFVTLSVVNTFFVDVLAKISEMRLPLDLSEFEVRHFAQEPNNHRDLQIYSTFIKSQTNLNEIRLPMPGDITATGCRAFIQSVAKSVSKVHITSDKYMSPTFLKDFSKLRHIGCDFEMRPFLLSGEKYPKLRSLEMQKGILSCTVPLVAESFPNITKLNLSGNCDDIPPIDDRCLQTICQNLKQIKFLVIGACASISDYGVTGVRREYCEKLFRSRAICLDPTMVIPREEISGSPLSSLRGLTHLTFTGQTTITDVGIFFGFRFEELRSFSMRNNVDISDWGLDWLGKLNPNLDLMYLGLGPWVTSLGVNKLRSRLRRIKRRNAIYIYPNQEYYSSDESYAMESDDERR